MSEFDVDVAVKGIKGLQAKRHKEARKHLARLDVRNYCPNCGHKNVEKLKGEDMFCTRCGLGCTIYRGSRKEDDLNGE